MAASGPAWEDIDRLFEAALERPRADRAAFLADACRGNPALHGELAALLAAHDRAGAFLEAPAVDAADGLLRALVCEPDDAAQADAPSHAGPYRLVRLLGTGGMGTVYLAERDDGQFRQQVAVKLLQPGAGTEHVAGRLRAERQILAALDHPGIARVFDGGVTAEGQPYLVMEYVEGLPLTEHCGVHRLSLEDRLRLFVAVGQAVQYAHSRLVVHRDLKPSNILVTGEGRVKLLDFGIAKLLDPASAGLLDSDEIPVTMPLTQAGTRWMTPEYASPEQVRGEVITTASDVYQLGVLLYELLTGLRPYRVSGSSRYALERAICEQESTAPSAACTDGGASPLQRRRLRGDLDAIVLKALRKEPAHRYASAEALVADLRRYLAGLPVEARRGTATYRLRKFAQRHRWGVAAGVAFFLLLAGSTVAIALLQAQTVRERDRALIEAEKLGRVSTYLTDLFRASDPYEAAGDTVSARTLLERGVARAAALADQPAVQAQLLMVMGTAYRNLGRYDTAQRLMEQALAARRAALGEGHPDVASTLNDLGMVLRDQGAYDSAASSLRLALHQRQALFGPDHPQALESMENLARVLRDASRPEEAEPLFRRVLAMRERLEGVHTLAAANTMDHLGLLLWDRGAYQEGERLLLRAIEIRREQNGEALDLATSLNNLGLLLKAQGRHEEAEKLYREAVRIWQAHLGRNHPFVARGLNNVGMALVARGRLEPAAPILEEALAIRREIYGNEHVEIANGLLNLADLRLRQKDYAASERLLQEGLAISSVHFPDHIVTAAILNALGKLAFERGEYLHAERFYRDVLDRLEHIYGGAPNPRVAMTQHTLAQVLKERGAYAAAEQLFLAALEAKRSTLPPENESVAATVKSLVDLYVAMGDAEKAARYRSFLPAPAAAP